MSPRPDRTGSTPKPRPRPGAPPAGRACDRQRADVARRAYCFGRQLPRLSRPRRHRPRRHTTDEADQFPRPHVRPRAHDKASDRIVSYRLSSTGTFALHGMPNERQRSLRLCFAGLGILLVRWFFSNRALNRNGRLSRHISKRLFSSDRGVPVEVLGPRDIRLAHR